MAPDDCDDGGLFSGVEDGPAQRAGTDPVVPPMPDLSLTGMVEPIVRAWWEDLTINEFHAFTLGFAPWFLFVVTGHPAMLAAGCAVILAAMGLRKFENRPLRVVVREPWYCMGGGSLGWMVGAWTIALLKLIGVLAEVGA